VSTIPAASPQPVTSPEHTAGAALADRLGIRVDRADPSLGGCGAVATFPAPPDAVLPTGAVLALVDATARAAAEAAVTVSGRHPALVATAAGVQFREQGRGTITARATVPCEGVITDRADADGLFRFSVAVDVVDPSGARVAAGTVQWTGRMDGDSGVPHEHIPT
jgi:hypothetical protein